MRLAKKSQWSLQSEANEAWSQKPMKLTRKAAAQFFQIGMQSSLFQEISRLPRNQCLASPPFPILERWRRGDVRDQLECGIKLAARFSTFLRTTWTFFLQRNSIPNASNFRHRLYPWPLVLASQAKRVCSLDSVAFNFRHCSDLTVDFPCANCFGLFFDGGRNERIAKWRRKQCLRKIVWEFSCPLSVFFVQGQTEVYKQFVSVSIYSFGFFLWGSIYTDVSANKENVYTFISSI